jgi:hypothetical protein
MVRRLGQVLIYFALPALLQLILQALMNAAEGGRSLDLGSALNAVSLSPNKSHAFVVGRDGKSSSCPTFTFKRFFFCTFTSFSHASSYYVSFFLHTLTVN